MKETLRHRKAFNYYYALGDQRTLQMVANEFTVSRQSIDTWKREFNWLKRVEQRDIENGKKLEAKTDRTIVNTKADYRAEIKTQLGILKAILNKVIQDFKNNNIINVNTINELEKVVSSYEKLCKLDLSIMGENLDKQEVIINILGEANENNN